MATYTAVLVVPNELDQDYVIEQLERLGVVAFCGPGSLVQDIDPDDPVCEKCGGPVAELAPVMVDGRALCVDCAEGGSR